MPRKRRDKKDPVIQKLNFDEGSDEAPTIQPHSGGISPRETEIADGRKTPETVDAQLPTASEQPGIAEEIPTDFAHRDRLRFTRPDSMSTDHDQVDSSPDRFLVTCVCLIFLIILVQWIKTEGYNLFLKWYLDLWVEEEHSETNRDDITATSAGRSFMGFLWSFLVAFVLGLSCLICSWSITYQDSLQPGEFPPSPVSPKKYRKRSGHTFHSSYVMALINGVAVFALSAWWLCT